MNAKSTESFIKNRPDNSLSVANGNKRIQISGEGAPFLARPDDAAFSLVEVLLVVVLLSLIVLALMAVFDSTQRAFRAGVTQTDVLEGSRAAMDLMTSDLKSMTYSSGVSNGPINLCIADNSYVPVSGNWPLTYSPLLQNLPGTANPNTLRTNLLNYFFLIGRQNNNGSPQWVGVGYVVNSTNQTPLYPLYRFYQTTNIWFSPTNLLNNFLTQIAQNQWTNMSYLMDGVVSLRLLPYDANGYWMTNSIQYNFGAAYTYYTNVTAYPYLGRDNTLLFYSNTIPATVELQMGVLEDRVLQHAEGLPAQSVAQSNYLAQQAGRVHLFRQRVNILNVDPTVYQ